MPSLSVPLNQFDEVQNGLLLPIHAEPAGLPVPHPTRSFWIDSPGANPLAKVGSTGPLTEDADICIIGSGITGVSAAYHLSKAIEADSQHQSMKAVVLEARNFCSGATGRNGGHLTPAAFLDFRKYQADYGTNDTLKAFALEGHTVEGILKFLKEEKLSDAVDLVAGGHIALLLTDKEVSDANADFQAAKQAGLNLDHVTWLSAEEMNAKYGTNYPGFQFPAHNLWPLKLVTQLFLKAKDRTPRFSLTLHTQTPVEAITSLPVDASPRRWNLSTPRGNISCSYVLHATNAYASHLLPQLSGPAGIIPTRGQIIAVHAAVPLSKLSRSSWDANEGFEYWFPRPVKTDPDKEFPLVILGGGREASRSKFEYYEIDDSNINQHVGAALRGFLPGVFPGLYETAREPDMEWTGIMGYTKLRDPFVGPIMDPAGRGRCEGQFIAAGYTGHGMPRAFACAEVIAQMISAELLGNDWHAPDWLPERYLTWERDANTGL